MAQRVRTAVQPAPAAAAAAPPPVAASVAAAPLINKYRPLKFNLLAGQEDAVIAIQTVLDDKSAKAFLMIGPRGTGETTSARIIMRAVGCAPTGLVEIDGAKFTGIDNMRDVTDRLLMRPLDGPFKVCIVDECHRLSAQAWDSLLKIIEEPPAHLYWVFCTTDPRKVPETVVSRCAKITFKLMTEAALHTVLGRICEREGIQLAEGVADIMVHEAGGSARQLISNLAVAKNASNRKAAARILQSAVESDAVIELARFLSKGNGSWASAMGIIDKLDKEGVPAESCRIVVCNYMTVAARRSTVDRDVGWFLHLAQAFAFSYGAGESMPQLLISIATALGIGDSDAQ
jgi:DNA polymerase III gamma/tau subunit